MVLEHGGDHAAQWAAIGPIAAKIGCAAETPGKWVRQAERGQALRAGPATAEPDRLEMLERENRELRQANEILRKASAYLTQAELDLRSKPSTALLSMVLPLAPSTWHAPVAQRADPANASPRARRELVLMEPIRRAHLANFEVPAPARSGGSSAGKASRPPAPRWHD